MKKQFEEELDEVKQNHEAELSQLRERLRKEKQSANTAVSDQVRGERTDHLAHQLFPLRHKCNYSILVYQFESKHVTVT